LSARRPSRGAGEWIYAEGDPATGLVRRAYGRIEVLDRPALRKMAEAEEAGRQA